MTVALVCIGLLGLLVFGLGLGVSMTRPPIWRGSGWRRRYCRASSWRPDHSRSDLTRK